MINVVPEDVSDCKIVVTNTATALYDLINTASSKGSAQQYYDGKRTDTVMIQPEDGDIRFLFNADPTATEGELLSSGVKYYLPNIEPFGMRLIRTGSTNVAVTVTYYRAERGESPVAVAPEVTLEATDIQIGAVEIKDADSDNRAQVTSGGALCVSAMMGDSLSLDTFGRQRVSNPQTLFDSKQIFDNAPLFWDDQEESGSGITSTYLQDEASTRLGVALNTAGKRTCQTYMRFNYQPGKSQLIIMTAVMSSGNNSGVKASVGYYDDENGLFFTNDEGTLKVVRRTYVSGSAVDNEVSQSSWNVDPMDGTGPSGVTIDPIKTQIMFFDLEWLGVGRVRTGFVVDGKFYVAHEFLNANNLNTVYITTPNLPLKYQIENDGTGAATTMDHICATVISEGGTEDLGNLRYASTAGTHVDATTENTIYALIGIRLKAANIGATIKLIDSNLQLTNGSKQVEWLLIFNPTVAGTFTYNDETNSSVQIATGATANTVTGGSVITGGYLESGGNQAGNAGSTGKGIQNARLLGAAIDGTVDELVLCARPIGGSTAVDIEAGMTWREIS